MISNPLKSRIKKTWFVKLTTVIAWVVAGTVTIPSIIFSRLVILPFGQDSPGLCLELWQKRKEKLSYNIAIVLLQFIIPLVVMAVLY